MDDYCLKEGKRCIMWDDEKSGFFLVRISNPLLLHVLHRGKLQVNNEQRCCLSGSMGRTGPLGSCERAMHTSPIRLHSHTSSRANSSR